MNKWYCPHCAEELLGSVNRCWKCGQRVMPPAFDRVMVAEEVSSTASDAASSATQEVTTIPTVAAAAAVALTWEDLSLASAKEPPRRGSPFSFGVMLAHRPPQEPFVGQGPYRQESKASSPPKVSPVAASPAMYPRNQGAIGGVAASMTLGIVSLAMLPFTIFGSVVALIGVGCGVWGMFHQRKGVALVALLLCCLALAISLYMIGFMLYEQLNPSVLVGPTGGAAAP